MSADCSPEVKAQKTKGRHLRDWVAKDGVDVRNDQVTNQREAMTVVTSGWGNGTIGPLFYQVPEGR